MCSLFVSSRSPLNARISRTVPRAFARGTAQPLGARLPAHKKQNALSRSRWNRQRPSCTIDSSCYRYRCTPAEKFRRENSDSSDLRFGKSGFFHDLPRPRPTFSWSPTMAPFRANGTAVFGRGLSRTAPGEWLENLCSFTPGSVPRRPATGDYTFSDAYAVVNSAKSSSAQRGPFFLRNGQGRACPSALYRRQGEKSISIFGVFHRFCIIRL